MSKWDDPGMYVGNVPQQHFILQYYQREFLERITDEVDKNELEDSLAIFRKLPGQIQVLKPQEKATNAFKAILHIASFVDGKGDKFIEIIIKECGDKALIKNYFRELDKIVKDIDSIEIELSKAEGMAYARRKMMLESIINNLKKQHDIQ